MNLLISQWIIPILTSVTAAILIKLARPSGLLAKKLLIKGTSTVRDSVTFTRKEIPSFILFTVFVFNGIIPISYNSWWLYKLVNLTSLPSRLEVACITFAIVTIFYWTMETVAKLQEYSMTDFSGNTEH